MQDFSQRAPDPEIIFSHNWARNWALSSNRFDHDTFKAGPKEVVSLNLCRLESRQVLGSRENACQPMDVCVLHGDKSETMHGQTTAEDLMPVHMWMRQEHSIASKTKPFSPNFISLSPNWKFGVTCSFMQCPLWFALWPWDLRSMTKHRWFNVSSHLGWCPQYLSTASLLFSNVHDSGKLFGLRNISSFSCRTNTCGRTEVLSLSRLFTTTILGSGWYHKHTDVNNGSNGSEGCRNAPTNFVASTGC